MARVRPCPERTYKIPGLVCREFSLLCLLQAWHCSSEENGHKNPCVPRAVSTSTEAQGMPRWRDAENGSFAAASAPMYAQKARLIFGGNPAKDKPRGLLLC
jgi:hypothetical protein